MLLDEYLCQYEHYQWEWSINYENELADHYRSLLHAGVIGAGDVRIVQPGAVKLWTTGKQKIRCYILASRDDYIFVAPDFRRT